RLRYRHIFVRKKPRIYDPLNFRIGKPRNSTHFTARKPDCVSFKKGGGLFFHLTVRTCAAMSIRLYFRFIHYRSAVG
ncbi:MAG: hypothetical protein LZF84_04840, partial [Nitrosomonas sp.]